MKLNTYFVDHDTMIAIWQNARWFSPCYFKSRLQTDGRFRVTTNYDAKLFIREES